MKGKHYLNVGDVVTFGHLGGHDISPGQMAPKQPAEFQFMVSFICTLHTTSQCIATDIVVVCARKVSINFCKNFFVYNYSCSCLECQS